MKWRGTFRNLFSIWMQDTRHISNFVKQQSSNINLTSKCGKMQKFGPTIFFSVFWDHNNSKITASSVYLCYAKFKMKHIISNWMNVYYTFMSDSMTLWIFKNMTFKMSWKFHCFFHSWLTSTTKQFTTVLQIKIYVICLVPAIEQSYLFV